MEYNFNEYICSPSLVEEYTNACYFFNLCTVVVYPEADEIKFKK